MLDETEITNQFTELNRKLDLVLKNQSENINPIADWWDLSRVCRELNITKRTVFNYIHDGLLGCSHLAGDKKLFFKKNEIEKLISDHFVEAFFK